MGNTHPIPKQIKTGNISPCNPKGKGDYFISKNTVLNAAKHLKIDPKIISPEAYSSKNGNTYVSWKGFYNLPDALQTHIKNLAVKKHLDFGIKTGKQKDGHFLIVFDCDNDNEKATEYKEFIFKFYGKTFTRKTPSNGYHVYYTSPDGGILKNNMHIDLRHYITIDDKPLDMEIKQGSFIKEIGANRQTVEDLEIRELNPKIDFIKAICKKYPTAQQIKPFLEDKVTSKPHINNESLKVSDDKLFEILETKYLPKYISLELKGQRDNTIIPGTFGFLNKRNMPVKQMEKVLKWINDVAEYKKAEKGNRTPDHRNYNFNSKPRKLAGSGVLREYGFNDFVNAINKLDPEYKTDNQNEDKPEDLRGLIDWNLSIHRHPPVKVLTDYLSENLKLYKDLTTNLFYEKETDGSYTNIGSERIVTFFNNEFGVNGISQDLSWRALNGITNPIKKDYELLEFKNGILNTRTEQFNENKKLFDKLPKISLPFNWNEKLEGDSIQTVITEILTDKHHLGNMEQWIKTVGYFFMKDNNEDVHTIVVGPPGTGKTTLATILNRIFNCSNVKTTDLYKAERFRLFPIIDKDVNIDDDLNNGVLKDIGVLNGLVSGRCPDVERKGKDEPITPAPGQIPKLYANGNTLPPVLGGGFWDRLNLIYALNEFRGTEKDKARLQPEIEAGKHDKDLEWLVWDSIHEYWNLRRNGEKVLSIEQMKENEKYYRNKSYPLLNAIDELFERTPSDESYLKIEEVTTDLIDWCKTKFEEGLIMEEHSTPSLKQIKKAMDTKTYDLELRRVGESDKNGYNLPIRVYVYIKKRKVTGQNKLESGIEESI